MSKKKLLVYIVLVIINSFLINVYSVFLRYSTEGTVKAPLNCKEKVTFKVLLGY